MYSKRRGQQTRVVKYITSFYTHITIETICSYVALIWHPDVDLFAVECIFTGLLKSEPNSMNIGIYYLTWIMTLSELKSSYRYQGKV